MARRVGPAAGPARRAVPPPRPCRGRLAEAFEAAARHWPARGRAAQPGGVAAHRRPPPGRSTGCGPRRWRRARSRCSSSTADVQHEAAAASWPTRVGWWPTSGCGCVFLCAHPSLAPEAAAALSPAARARRVHRGHRPALPGQPSPTMAARLTRAKRRLAATGVPFAVPRRDRPATQRVGVVAVGGLPRLHRRLRPRQRARRDAGRPRRRGDPPGPGAARAAARPARGSTRCWP